MTEPLQVPEPPAPSTRPLRLDAQCGCGIPNRSAYWYVIPMSRKDDPRSRGAIVRLFLCVKHRVDPHDLAAVRSKFEFDNSDEWVIEDVECKPAAQYAREADLTAAFEPLGEEVKAEWYAALRMPLFDEQHSVPVADGSCGYSEPLLGRCICGDPKNHEPGGRFHTEPVPLAWGVSDTAGLTITEAAAEPVLLDIRLRSESEEEDDILRHFRGARHNGTVCRACKQEQWERSVGNRRVAECHAEIGRLRSMLNSIIEG